MITDDGWFDWCERVPGPADKVYSAVNTHKIYIPHSAVGYYPGWASRLFSTARHSNGQYTGYAAASVHLWIPQSANEKVKQHFSVFKSCWGSGSAYPNCNGVAAENAGGPPGNENEALTSYQVDMNARAIHDLAEFSSWTPRRPIDEFDITATLYEHRECKRWGSDPTACPSERMSRSLWPVLPAKLAALKGTKVEEFFDMDEATFRRILREEMGDIEYRTGDAKDGPKNPSLSEIRDSWLLPLFMRLEGYKMETKHLTSQNHLTQEDAPFVGMSLSVEAAIRLRDIWHVIKNMPPAGTTITDEDVKRIAVAVAEVADIKID